MGSAKMAARFLGSNAWPVYEGLCLDGVNEKPEYLLNLIKVLKDERPLKNKENAKEFAQKVKKMLSTQNEKWAAICLMANVLKDFDAEVVWQNLLFWIRSLTQIINTNQSDALLDLTLRVIPKLLQISLEFDDHAREISCNIIHPLLNNLLQSTGTTSRCLVSKIAVFRQCILCYPAPTGRFRTQIENLCLAVMSKDNEKARFEACRCIAVLPRCGSSGEKGTKFAEFWSKQFMMIMETLNISFDDLLHEKRDRAAQKEQRKMIRLAEIPLAEPEFSTNLSIRIKSLLLILREMLSYKFPNTVEVDINAIICLCNRIFYKEIQTSNATIETACLFAVMPSIWHSLLSLIDLLIVQMGSLLLPFEFSISQAAYQLLTIDESVTTNSNEALRKQAYHVLESWNSIVGTTSSDFLKKIVNISLIDIKPHFREAGKPAPKRDGKKKKNRDAAKLQEDMMGEEMAFKKIDRTENHEIACSSLSFLKTLINMAGPIMNAELVSKIETELITICMDLIDPFKQENCLFPAPYGFVKCRQMILKCVFELANLYHHQIPTPMSTLVSIFQGYLNDPVCDVSAESKRYLNLLDKVIHPTMPSLREYHIENVVAAETNPKTETTATVLSTGLFNELRSMSHEQSVTDIETYQQHGSMKPGNIISSEGSSFSITNEEEAGKKYESETSKEVSLARKTVHSSVNEKLSITPGNAMTPENPIKEVKQSFKNVDNFNTVPCEEMQEDDKEDDKDDNGCNGMGEVSAKRQKLDIGDETENNHIEDQCKREDTILKISSGEAIEKVKKGVSGAEVLETKEDQEQNELRNDTDDESNLFLKSFVNSYPDS